MCPRHPDKEVEDAVAFAECSGGKFRRQGHWGRLYCPQADRAGCQIGISGTPRNGSVHARQIRRAVRRCPHANVDTDDEDL